MLVRNEHEKRTSAATTTNVSRHARDLLRGPHTLRKWAFRIVLLALIYFGVSFVKDGLLTASDERSGTGSQLIASPKNSGGWMTAQRLRILPLGDSITEGFGSSSNNGYRGILYDLLTQHGNSVQMVGSLKDGSMLHNNHEGWGGLPISLITEKTASYGARPNVILLLAGTNDADHEIDLPNAAHKLDNLITQLFAACPDAAILVGTILPSTDPRITTNIAMINADLSTRIALRASQGQHVSLVDLPAGFSVDSHLGDFLHPNDQGYQHIAYAWAAALNRVADQGWITAPAGAARANGVLGAP